ncbi:MAG: HPr family phosphocarrier protein [bacterium]|nr:HPr family phosphocarrier protein [bacterium]
MRTFSYEITDQTGIHARPAGLLVKEAKNYASKITLCVNQKSAEATKLLALMSLGAKHGSLVVVQIEGPDEDDAAVKMEQFFKDNL